MLRYSSGPYWNEYLVNDLSQTSFTRKRKLHAIHLAWAVAGETEGISSHTHWVWKSSKVCNQIVSCTVSLGCRALSWDFWDPDSIPLYVWSSDLFFCQAEDKNKSIFYSVSVPDILSVCSTVISVSSEGRQASIAQRGTCTLLTHIKGRQKVSHTAYGSIYLWVAQGDNVKVFQII